LSEALRTSAAKKLPRYESLQPLYNLADRAGFEKGLEPLCQKERLGVIPYFSLAAGFLTGKYRSQSDLGKSPRGARVKEYLNERGKGILKALDEVSARLKVTPVQVALAWLTARPSVTAPIASATNLAQLEDLIAGARLRLDHDAIEQLNRASA
jgi:aryl-alcohol dehydrogenase-like predicted oxidoreductase